MLKKYLSSVLNGNVFRTKRVQMMQKNILTRFLDKGFKCHFHGLTLSTLTQLPNCL